MKYILAITIFLVTNIVPKTAIAQEWTGAVDSDWNNSANWNEWPLDEEVVTIDPLSFTGAMAAPVISANSTFIPERLFVVNGATLIIQANLTVENRMIIEGDGALVNLNNGTLTTGRLICESGGIFTLNNGTANVLSVLALGDDEVSPSGMIMHGGTMNVTGEFGFDVVLEESAPYFELNAGTLTVDGEAVWYSETPGAGRGKVIVNGGTAVINGPLYSNFGGPLEVHLEVNGGMLTINGPGIDLSHATDSIIVSGGELHLEGNMAIDNDGVVHGYGGHVFFDQQAELDGSGSFHFHDITISSGASLVHADPNEISVSGDWINLGTFTAEENTVAFTGSLEQNIHGTGFHGLRVANSGAGVTLIGPSTVSGELYLENGIIHSDDEAMLILLDNATASSGSSFSHIDGPMRKIGDDDFVFPVGDNGSWRRIGISGINDQSTEFTAQYFHFPYANTTSIGPELVDVSNVEYWRLERAVTTEEVQVTLHWEDASVSGLSDCEDLVLAYWDGTAWQAQASTITGSCIGTEAGTVGSIGEVPEYNVVTIGTGTSTVGIANAEIPDQPTISHDTVEGSLRLGSVKANSVLLIFDSRGSLILQQNVGSNDKPIELAELRTGIYHAKLFNKEATAFLKFVIQ